MSRETPNRTAGCLHLLVTAGTLAILAVHCVTYGFTLQLLWRWFAPPLGLPAMPFLEAIGVTLMVTFLTHQTPAAVAVEGAEYWKETAGAVLLRPATFLVIGWVVHSLMVG